MPAVTSVLERPIASPRRTPPGRRPIEADPTTPPAGSDADPASASASARAPGAGAPRQRAGDTETKRAEPAVGTRLSATEIHENVRTAAEEELVRPAAALWFSSIAAGLAITFSFLGAAYTTTLVPARFAEAAGAAAYPIGFIFVVLARNQLFTENTLEPVIPFLSRWDRKTLRRLLRLWAIVLSGNLLGTLAIALILAHTPMVSSEMQRALDHVASHVVPGGFWLTAYRAVFAGWLIALLAWLVASTRATGAQIVLIWLTTAPISAFGFRHSIAGSAEAFYLAARQGVTWWYSLGSFIAPSVIGNVVGGVILVAILNHGQVAADMAADGRRNQWSQAGRGRGFQ
jgi:formate/nitrite transporter FocA (FNT family)